MSTSLFASDGEKVRAFARAKELGAFISHLEPIITWKMPREADRLLLSLICREYASAELTRAATGSGVASKRSIKESHAYTE